eukprot:scaffold86361_cov29-Tisochrysis_lutea.AAC.2
MCATLSWRADGAGRPLSCCKAASAALKVRKARKCEILLLNTLLKYVDVVVYSHTILRYTDVKK